MESTRTTPQQNEMREKVRTAAYFVEASSCEKQLLWEKHHGNIPWLSESCGLMFSVGQVGEYPVTVDLSFDTIYGSPVVFYYSNSRLVDWDKVEEWLQKNTLNWIFNHCNAMNFAQCINAMRALTPPHKKPYGGR